MLLEPAITLIARDLSETPTPTGSLVEPCHLTRFFLGMLKPSPKWRLKCSMMEVLRISGCFPTLIQLDTGQHSFLMGDCRGVPGWCRGEGEVFFYKDNTTTLFQIIILIIKIIRSIIQQKAKTIASPEERTPDTSVICTYLSLYSLIQLFCEVTSRPMFTAEVLNSCSKIGSMNFSVSLIVYC